jgi:hypothetical protein
MIKTIFSILFLVSASIVFCQFPPAVGQTGSTAISKNSSVFINWASSIVQFNPGPEDISDPLSVIASFGVPQNALNQVEGNSTDIVSLGDGGSIILGFIFPISNGPGSDFAVFENSFSNLFLELAFVEVSTNGVDFVRFPSTSNSPNLIQTGSFGSTDPTLINNLAGKYRQGYGTPFDLEELIDSSALNLDSILYVKIIDVVGSIDSTYGSKDSNRNLINDPFPTPFPSAGFDLDGIGVIHQNNPLALAETTKSNLIIYPNPAINYLNIEINEPNLNYAIYNIQGAQMMAGQVNPTNKIDLQRLSSGSYFIEVTGKDFYDVKKIIVKK